MKALYAAAVVALAGLSAPADDKKDDPKDFPKLIVGKWEITKAGNPNGAQAGTTFAFDKDGKLKAVIKAGGMEFPAAGTYKLDKDKLTVKVDVGGMESEEVLTVKKLTADALELEDDKGGVDVLKKLKDKEKN